MPGQRGASVDARMVSLIDRLADAGLRRGVDEDDSAGDSVGWEHADRFRGVLAALRADYPDAGDEDEKPDPLSDIADVFGLDAVDCDLLWSAVAPDLNANIAIAYALLRGLQGFARASVGLVLELANVPSQTAEAFDRLSQDGPLRAHRLLDVTTAEPWLARGVSAPDPVVRAVAGAEPGDPAVAAARCPVVAMDLPGVEVVRRALESGAPLVWIRETGAAAGASTAAAAVEASGLGWVAVDARRFPAGVPTAEVAGRAAREAGLRTRALIILNAEALAEGGDIGAFQVLASAPVPVVAVSSRIWNSGWLARLPLTVEASAPTAAQRAALWRDHLGAFVDRDDELRQTLVGLRLPPQGVAETARYARMLATANGAELSAAIVRDAARRVGGTGSVNAGRVEAAVGSADAPTFDDLVLPHETMDTVRRLVNWARHRNDVAAQGALRNRGKGIAALFAGNPGTGKTLAAHVVAEELAVELFKVDLSAVVDKYIGETEKNLEKVFQAAESMNVVLFFDEADALFGSRSEVKDARDRYANQEIAYLLQRMEEFDGITILATNLRGNLDKAFSRRMSFIVHFPDPDEPTRLRIWHSHLLQHAEQDPADPIDVPFLAAQLELAGGDIRNIVLAAVYDAVSEGVPLGMRHLRIAASREYRKLGKVVPVGLG